MHLTDLSLNCTMCDLSHLLILHTHTCEGAPDVHKRSNLGKPEEQTFRQEGDPSDEAQGGPAGTSGSCPLVLGSGSPNGTQLRSLGPYTSHSTRYWSCPCLHLEFTSLVTQYAWAPSISMAPGKVWLTSLLCSGFEITGLSKEPKSKH